MGQPTFGRLLWDKLPREIRLGNGISWELACLLPDSRLVPSLDLCGQFLLAETNFLSSCLAEYTINTRSTNDDNIEDFVLVKTNSSSNLCSS